MITAAVADLDNFTYFQTGPTFRQTMLDAGGNAVATGFGAEPSYSSAPGPNWAPPVPPTLLPTPPPPPPTPPLPLTASPRKLFRGFTAGDQIGPYVSQLLLRDIPYGAQVISGRIRTLTPGVDYMTSYDDWLLRQDGCDADQRNCDDLPRYIRNGRDLAQYVHVDMDFNAFYNATFLLFSPMDPLRRCEATSGLAIEWARCLPYNNPFTPLPMQFPDRTDPAPGAPSAKSGNQIGIATFGPQHLVPLLVYSVHLAFLAVWHHKWGVHRRLRPEEYGGRVHNQMLRGSGYHVPASLVGSGTDPGSAVLNQNLGNPEVNILAYNALQNANRRRAETGTRLAGLAPASMPPDAGNRADGASWLLPMAYAEGSPLHPAYGSGHATAAGACATILKAFFTSADDPPARILDPLVPTDDGLALVRYTGADAEQITVEGEINKLASNISLGRNFAGVHWRSDYTESMRLGECIAISLLQDQACNLNEDYTFSFRSFDGATVTIARRTAQGGQPACKRPR